MNWLLRRRDILEMTTGAGSGHPGGSLSQWELFAAVIRFGYGGRGPAGGQPRPHGAGIYAALGRMGFVEPEEVVAGFRRKGSPYEAIRRFRCRGFPGAAARWARDFPSLRFRGGGPSTGKGQQNLRSDGRWGAV